MNISNEFWWNYIPNKRKEARKLTNENQTRGKPAGKCIECGKQVWYPTTMFCKECAIEFYENIIDKLEGESNELG